MARGAAGGTPTSTNVVLKDDDEEDGYLLDHIKFQPPAVYTEGKRCNWCGDRNNRGWCGVVLQKNRRTVKVIGKVLLCQQCLVDGGWLHNDAVQRR